MRKKQCVEAECKYIKVDDIIKSGDIDNLYRHIGASSDGLTYDMYNENIIKYGINEMPDSVGLRWYHRLGMQFKNLMIIVLLVSAFFSIGMTIYEGNYADLVEGITILIIVLFNALIGVVQESKADASIKALKSKTICICKVKRDGVIHHIDAINITIGDVLIIEAGDIISADMKVIEAAEVKVDESILTGESLAISKRRGDIIYAGSTCVKGRIIAIVVGIAVDTQIGKLAAALDRENSEPTPLTKSIGKISKIITIVVVSIVVVIFLMELIMRPDPNIADSFMVAIALAVAAIPESLPAVITIIMALGVQTMAKKKVIIRHLHAVETLGCCDIICSDKTGTITQNKMKVTKAYTYSGSDDDTIVMKRIAILCNDCYDSDDGVSGDPTEVAIYNYAEGVDGNGYKRVSEKAFDSERKMMTVLLKSDFETVSYTKGAIDSIISRCDRILINGDIVDMTEAYRESIKSINEEYCSSALRVLAYAYKNYTTSTSIDGMESNMIFVGMTGITDPPRKQVAEAVSDCRRAGMTAIMITGDHSNTAYAIAHQVGIAKRRSQVITGEEMVQMGDERLKNTLHKYTVFARVTPQQKMQIVSYYKQAGHIVAMTGDGVNDAGGLKAADIGVGMGISGTDVVKNVADMIVTDDDFSSIIVAVEEGRKIYANIQKSIQFLLSTNIVEVACIFLTLLFFPGNVFLLPAQILFINLVTDSLPAFGLGLESAERDIMRHTPRKNTNNLFSGNIGKNIIIQGIMQTMIVMGIYIVSLSLWESNIATSVAFYTIIYMQLLHSINCKTNYSLFDIPLFVNKTFNICFIVTLIIDISVSILPFMQNILGLTALNMSQWIMVIIASIVIIPFTEISKMIVNKKNIYTM